MKIEIHMPFSQSIASKRMKWLFEQQNVMVQFSVCPGGVLSVRTSAQCYNTLDDFARAADALLAYRTHMETDGHFARHVFPHYQTSASFRRVVIGLTGFDRIFLIFL